ncbi:MAG: lysine--tRNA ligase [Fimbriimonadaceae bacterium]|nr:lysine--tRNA ligase [Fimbriimonadaceae bacterium]
MSEDRSIREIRLEKLQQLRDLGFDPYATEKFKIDHSVKHLLNEFDQLADLSESGKEDKPILSIAGRVVALREMGKAAFAHLSDGEDRIQLYIRKNDLDEWNENAWPAFKLVDIGDHLGVTGHLFTTKTGEKSLYVHTLTPLSKALHNLPLGKEKDGEQWYGLTDVDQRYRHRHLDLICNHEAREQLLNRSRIVSEVRRFFDNRGYLEVETPLLQLEAGGAAARPFLTHYNAYDIQVKLRISLELYLKRIICGDVPKVYEIGRVFRNEGVSNRHNPEFTLLEWYEAYANLEDMMECVEDLFRHVVTACVNVYGQVLTPGQRRMFNRSNRWMTIVSGLNPIEPRLPGADLYFMSQLGSDVIESTLSLLSTGNEIQFYSANLEYLSGEASILDQDERGGRLICLSTTRFRHSDGLLLTLEPGIYTFMSSVYGWASSNTSNDLATILDFTKPWHRVDLMTAIEERSGIKQSELTNLIDAKAAMKRVGLPTEKENNLGGIIEKLLEHFVEPHLQEPTFIVGYPIETSPLAKKDPNRPGFTRRFEGYVLGREVCNAFSEINDPIDQRERFEQQMGERDKGDDEAHPMDEQFIYALESGMPPTGGCGIGIDRLVMLLTGAEHLREILLFPMMRPELSHDNPED